MLEKEGFVVDVASDGRQAVDAWRRGTYDLILMDCQMPHLDGYEATREIRREERETSAVRRIPIIALTAHAMKGAADDCRRAGMDDYLTKPLDREQLRRCLKEHMKRRDSGEVGQRELAACVTARSSSSCSSALRLYSGEWPS